MPLMRSCLGCGRPVPMDKRRCPSCEPKFKARQTADFAPLRAVYNTHRWRKVTRPAVLERDGYRCRYCGVSADDGATLDVAHRESTTRLLKAGRDPFDPDVCVTLCRSCHNRTAPHHRDRKLRAK